ncbi:MAG TPA: YqeG family HAD IIIA-type phosphatase [Clostridia bacterium]|nr:YqeG family HAD IIIA-type phosphatase [Clostridia bacterium]
MLFLKPDLYVDSILDIPIDLLVESKIKGLIVDLDNTITEWNSPELKKEIFEWFAHLKIKQINACIASNNSHSRVSHIGQYLGIPAISKAGKPRRRSFLQAMKLLNTLPESTAVIGDQLFTDILGGKRLGLYTILVKPLNPREFIGTRLMRQLEKIVLKKCIFKEDKL